MLSVCEWLTYLDACGTTFRSGVNMSHNTLSRVVWRVSLPIIFVEATETLDHLIDTIFLARVGVTELGAIAVADSILCLFLVAPLALMDAMPIRTPRRVRQG